MSDLGHLVVVGAGSEPGDKKEGCQETEEVDDCDSMRAQDQPGTKKQGEKALPGFKKEMSSSEDTGTPFGEF